MGDALRILAVVVAATTYSLAVANLIVSLLVLREKPFTWRHFWGSGGGFLWSHIVFVTLPFQGFVTWGIVEVLTRSGDPLSWRAPALLVLSCLMSTGYAIIYRVELSRLKLKQAASDGR